MGDVHIMYKCVRVMPRVARKGGKIPNTRCILVFDMSMIISLTDPYLDPERNAFSLSISSPVTQFLPPIILATSVPLCIPQIKHLSYLFTYLGY